MSDSSKLAELYDVHGEKLRYLVVGVCNTAVSYALFLALLAVVGPPLRTLSGSSAGLLAQIGHGYYVVVQWIGWVLMVPVSTTTMKYFAFRSRGRLLPQVGRAYLVYLPAQGLSSLILWAAALSFPYLTYEAQSIPCNNDIETWLPQESPII